MADSQLELIRQYLDTSGQRLAAWEKDSICRVLEDPSYYDGYTSDIFTETDSGKDYNGRWRTVTQYQYRINIDSMLSIDCRSKFECDDGYERTGHWDWDNAYHITNAREIAGILNKIL